MMKRTIVNANRDVQRDQHDSFLQAMRTVLLDHQSLCCGSVDGQALYCYSFPQAKLFLWVFSFSEWRWQVLEEMEDPLPLLMGHGEGLYCFWGSGSIFVLSRFSVHLGYLSFLHLPLDFPPFLVTRTESYFNPKSHLKQFTDLAPRASLHMLTWQLQSYFTFPSLSFFHI